MKRYNFKITGSLKKEFGSIREKSDIIKFLLNIMQYISSLPLKELIYSESNEIKSGLVIHIDKMSRIFYCEENKIHTFQLPFIVNTENENISFCYKDQTIDNKTLAILLSIFLKQTQITKSLDLALDIFMNTMEEFCVDNQYYSNYCWDLIIFLLSFEPGYLRYDHDSHPDRMDPYMHPLDHLDLFYSSNNTFKIGLNSRINQNNLIDLMDINIECKYLK